MFHRRNKVAVENSYRAPIYPAPKVGYVSSTTIQSDRVLVQFSVPDHEWNELEKSKKWKGFVKRLEECQREQIRNRRDREKMGTFEEILAGVPQEIKTLEVDTEKKVFKLNGVDFGNGCDYFEISCAGGEGFKIRMELSKCIICANYGLDNALKEPPAVRIKE